MSRQPSDISNDSILRQRALARWENEGGKTPPVGVVNAAHTSQTEIPQMTNAEIVALRVRVIALENLVISFLVTASDHQLKLVREMADYILPRPGFTPHPLTVHAAEHMIDLVDRAAHYHSEGDSTGRATTD